jgi:adenosylcobinamide-GDP ribazoletransferase
MTEPTPKPAAPSDEEPSASSHVPVAATQAPHGGAHGGIIARAIARVLASLRFFSRLPIPIFAFEADPHAPLDLSRGVVPVVIAGAIIGSAGSVVVVAAAAAGLPPLLATLLGLATLSLVTGAMHEDGLADTADGFWGGRTAERRLDIMRDSRVGSFGVMAIVIVFSLRAVALAAVFEHGGVYAAAVAMIAVAATSRVAALIPLWLLPAARRDGAAAAAVAPSGASTIAATIAALVLAAILYRIAGLPVQAAAFGLAAAFAAAWAIARIAKAKIGGHTGDVAGAAQQLGETAMLIALAAR